MSQQRVFYRYSPVCDFEGCGHQATVKIAAPWTDGTQSELRNYGVYCSMHADDELERARQRQARTRLCPGEQVGEMRRYELIEGRRDAELVPVG